MCSNLMGDAVDIRRSLHKNHVGIRCRKRLKVHFGAIDECWSFIEMDLATGLDRPLLNSRLGNGRLAVELELSNCSRYQDTKI